MSDAFNQELGRENFRLNLKVEQLEKELFNVRGELDRANDASRSARDAAEVLRGLKVWIEENP